MWGCEQCGLKILKKTFGKKQALQITSLHSREHCDADNIYEDETEKRGESNWILKHQKPVSFKNYSKPDLEHVLPFDCHQIFEDDC